MIIWGSGGNAVDLGVVENRRCDTCEKERPFKLMLQYRFAHVYYIFRWVTKKQYTLLCEVCQRGWELKAPDIEKNLTKNPIPFMTRYGWTLLVAGVAAAMVIPRFIQ